MSKASEIKYTITGESVTVLADGKTICARAGELNFIALRDAALRGDVGAVRAAASPAGAVFAWSRGRFAIEDDAVRHDGEPVSAKFGARLRAMAAAGEDVGFLLRFFERLSKNPSRRSIEQLFDFLEHESIPILPDGCFLAYKGVTAEHMDVHTKSFDNRPGSVNAMPRADVSDDPDRACDAGFHVGALTYATWFLKQECPGGHVVVCRVAPEDVVSVPKDHSARKVRVWRYEVVGEWSGEPLSSTTHEEPLTCDAPTTPSAIDDDSVYSPEGANKVNDRRRHEWMMARTPAQLMSLPAKDLRDFISRGLRVVGAVPGGSKAALVGQIARLRGRGQ